MPLICLGVSLALGIVDNKVSALSDISHLYDIYVIILIYMLYLLYLGFGSCWYDIYSLGLVANSINYIISTLSNLGHFDKYYMRSFNLILYLIHNGVKSGLLVKIYYKF